MRLANVAKQSGSSACGLFAIGFITDLAFGRDPEYHVFNQGEMRREHQACVEGWRLMSTLLWLSGLWCKDGVM